MSTINNTTNIEENWDKVVYWFIKKTGKKPTLNTILFMIGVQELGQGKRPYAKEEKQDLMHLALCKLFSSSGFYELEGQDQDGWPHFRLVEDLPPMDLIEQERFIKWHIIDYFSDHIENENHNI